MEAAQTKVCRVCHRELSLESFYRNTHSKDGLQSSCKDCHNEAYRKSIRKKSSMGGANPLLADYTPRELMLELKSRGYTGELRYTKIIDIEKL